MENNNINLSLCAAANRPKWWKRLLESIKGNSINVEVIFAGNEPPPEGLSEYNFKWIRTNVKPAQAYEICFRMAQGELISWMADDATYGGEEKNLDKIYDFYKSFNDYKVMVGNRTVEDGHDCHSFHHFFGGKKDTPIMIPMGFISKQFMDEIGGYDKNFVGGQSENDLVMRGLAAGGRVEMCPNSFVYLHHRQVHPDNKDNKFRACYRQWDRVYLEKCWVNKNNGCPHGVGLKRLLPFQPFEDKDILTISQGERGFWQ